MTNARNNNASSRQKRSRRRNTNVNRKFRSPLLRNLPSYEGQPISTLKVPGIGGLLTTIVTTGVINRSIACDIGLVTDWFNRFASLYEEYRLIRVDAKIDTFDVTNPGLIKIYFDEKIPTAPTVATAFERSQMDLAASNAGRHVITWCARDLTDLNYSNTSTVVTPVWLKIYTDAANLGSSVVATNYGFVSFMLTFQFRGYSD